MSINRVTISGNLTRDPELRATPNGSAVLRFGMAVNDRRRNAATGEWEDVPNFVDCVVFGNRAEPLSRFLSKGSKVFVEGKLRYSSWEKDGQRRSKLEVVVDEVEFASTNRNQGEQNGGGYANSGGYTNSGTAPSNGYSQGYNASAPVAAQPPVATPSDDDVYDQDIPF